MHIVCTQTLLHQVDSTFLHTINKDRIDGPRITTVAILTVEGITTSLVVSPSPQEREQLLNWVYIHAVGNLNTNCQFFIWQCDNASLNRLPQRLLSGHCHHTSPPVSAHSLLSASASAGEPLLPIQTDS